MESMPWVLATFFIEMNMDAKEIETLLTPLLEQEGAILEEHLLHHGADEGPGDYLRIEDARHGLAEVPDGLPVVVPLAVEEPVHEPLEASVQGLEEENH